MRIDSFSAPTMATWQLTRDCNLACLHCCTDSAPGRALPHELSRERALSLAREIVAAGVPYAMIVGGEPTLVPHFAEVCRILSDGGVWLKVETNGMDFDPAALKGLQVRSVQISLDGATQGVFARQRPGGSLEKAVASCRAVVAAGLPLEITFAPTRLNIQEAPAVIGLALDLKAFRFNTGKLMRVGTAAKLWERLEPTDAQYADFRALLDRRKGELAGRLELCYEPFSIDEEIRGRGLEPSGTLLILPDGRVKVAAPLPYVCADLSRTSFLEAWDAYRKAWSDPRVLNAAERLAADPGLSAKANAWFSLDSLSHDLPAVV
ncbi:MAG: radical SAM protein [Elusimicrobia bacterium]|nr:radical SAM protein [Elusimicrobiota bacterium]